MHAVHTITALGALYETIPLVHLVAYLETPEPDVLAALGALPPTLVARVVDGEEMPLRPCVMPGHVFPPQRARRRVEFAWLPRDDAAARRRMLAELLRTATTSAARLQDEKNAMLVSPEVLTRFLALHAGAAYTLPDDELGP